MSGRATYRASAASRRRGGDRKTNAARHVVYGRQSFRLVCRRIRGAGIQLPTIILDQLVTEFTWKRSGAVMTGTLTFADPALRRLPSLVRKGDVVRCEVRAHSGAAWSPLWEMTVSSSNRAIRDRTNDLRLRSTLKPAQETRHHWRFRKGKERPNGWTADAITRAAARRFRVRLGHIAKAHHTIDKLVDKSASVLEIVTLAYAQERRWTGRIFDVSIARGVLDVTEIRRPKYMLLIGPGLIDGVIDDTVSPKFATAVVVTSTVKRTGSTKRRKLRVLVVDRARVKRYGYIKRTVHKSGLQTPAEARKYGERWLARTAVPYGSITLTHPGIPWVDRGDGVRLRLPEELLTADVYVTEAEHRVDADGYEMDLTCSTTDLWTKDERAARVRRKKAAAARERRRSHARSVRVDRPKPATARVRS